MAETLRIEIPIETIDKTDPALSTITAKFKELDSVVKQAQQSVKQDVQNMSSSVKQVSTSVSNVGKSTVQARQQVSAFDKTVQKSQKSLMSWVKQKYQIILEAKDKISPIISKISSGVKSFAGKTWNVTLKAVDLFTSPIRKVMSLLKSPLMAAGISLSLGAGLAGTVQTFANFEAGMSQVKAISGATGEEFAQLTAKAKEMGATTKFTATQSAEAFNYMAMAGWKTTDMLNGIEGIMNLAAASGEELGTTSDIVTDALTAFNLTAKDSAHFADVLAQASANSNTNVAKMGQTFQYVAPVAGAMGYSIEDTALAIGLMANAGIKGEKAGTSLRNIFTRLVDPPKDAAEAMKALGLSVSNTDGTMRPLNEVMGDLRKSFAGLTDEQKTQYASALAGQEAMSGLLAIVNASESDYNKLAEAVNNADGASKKMSNTMMDNLAGKWTLFKSALDGVKIALGERIKPYLMDALDWLTQKMPDIEDALMRGMNKLDQFVENTKEKIGQFTSTDEWQNADLFGKIKISWDELIGNPFSEWWDSSGKGLFLTKAKDLGNFLGTGISTGLLTLLGIDIDGTTNEGATVGKRFAEGFANGFDTAKVQSAVGKAMTGVLKNAGKIFTGDADISSWLSAAMVAKVASPLLGAGLTTAKLGKTIFGSGEGGLGLGGAILGSAAAGTGLKGLGASLGMLGIKMGSSATTGAGLIASGAAGIGGGLIGGGVLISGAKDIYKSFKSDNTEESKTYGASGALKTLGVGGGALAGAAIGSVVPVLGTAVGALIGAGIGGIGGWFAGEKQKENYAEEMKKAAEEAKKLKVAQEQAKYESKEMKDAIAGVADETMSSAEAALVFDKAVGDNLDSHFGNIKLSMSEIQDLAKQIVFDEQEQSFNAFSDATKEAANSMQSMQNAVSTMNKLNWKASLGMKFSESDVEAYKSGIDNLIQSAQTYLEDKHYQAKAAIDLLIEPGNEIDMTTGLNTMYSSLQEQVNSLGGELNAKVEVALEDGVITLDEQAEIENLQQQITDITDQLAEADMEATFQMMKVKYDGAALDHDSFAALQTEIQSQVEIMSQGYDQAYKVAVSNLQLQLKNGAINQEEFDAQLQALTEGYEAKLKELAVRVESFQLESIASAYGSELDGILPELEGTTAEKLGQAMHNAMANGVDVANWDTETAAKWLGLEGLSQETQAAIADRMSQVAASLPQQITDALSNVNMSEAGSGLQEGITDYIGNGLENADFSGVAESITAGIGTALSGIDFSESGSGLQEGLTGFMANSIEGADFTGVAEAVTAGLGSALSTIDMSESGGGLQEGITNAVSASFEGMDLSSATEGLTTSLSEAFSAADLSGISVGLQESLTAAISELDYSSIGTAIGSGVGNAISAVDMGPINSAISALKSNVGAAIDSAFAVGFQTTTTVTITVDYQLANPSATISFSGGGSGTATVSASIDSNAEGSIVGGPLLSWVGEDGPEAIIPLGSKRRSRGLSLWKQAGEMLGVLHNANGNIIAQNSIPAMVNENTQYINNMVSKSPVAESINEGEDEATYNIIPVASQNEQKSPQDFKIDVNISVNPKFEISGSGDEESVLRVIKSHIREMADEIGDEMAEKLADVFSNMPVSAV